MAELSRWCGRCATELRSGARFCSKCGQRVIEETPPAEAPGPGSELALGSVPAEHSGPGFTEVGAQRTAPAPGPDSPPRNEWSDWYRSTEPRLPFEPPPNQPLANQPLSGPPGYQPSEYQPSGYQPPGYQPRPYQPPVYRQAAMPTPVDEQPFGLRFESPPAKAPPWRPSGPVDGDRRSRAPLFWSVLSSAVAIAVVVCVLLLHPFSHNEGASDAANSAGTTPTASAAAANSRTATVSSSASAARSGSTVAVTERQAASTVAGMLASSVTDRTAIDNAYTDVDGCGPNLGNDAAVFTRAANSRRAMVARLATMPGRSTLPLTLLSDLASAWQESLAADQGLATWAKDEVAKGCVRNDTNDPGYRTTLTPDSEASQDKATFVAQWNPIAARYGLTSYQSSQL